MKKNSDSIHLVYENGFPKGEYAFSDRRLSVVVDNTGGITDLSLIKVWEKDGIPFPDLIPSPVLSRQGTKKRHPFTFYGPSIRFLSTQTDGQNLWHMPGRVKIGPSGFSGASEQYGHTVTESMCVVDNCILFAFDNNSPRREDMVIVFYPDGLYEGDFTRLHIITYGFVPVDESANSLHLKQTWDRPVFTADHGLLYVNGTVRDNGTDERCCFGIGFAGAVPKCVSNAVTHRMQAPWPEDKGSVGAFVIVAENEGDLLKQAETVRREWSKLWQRQDTRYRKLAAHLPQLEVKGSPSAGAYFRMAPLFLESMNVIDSSDYVCRRAACHKYGFAWSWDHLYGLLDMMELCDSRSTLKVLRHAVEDIRYQGENILAWLLAVLAFHQYFARTRDRRSLESFYPCIKEVIETIAKRCDGRGLFLDQGTTCADNPEQLGQRTETNYTPEQNGLWFSVLRLTENTARLFRDEAYAERLRKLSDLVRKHYLETFFDAGTGYLLAYVEPQGRKSDRVFLNTSTMAMDAIYGPNLLLDRIDSIARFIENELTHPFLRMAAPYWSDVSELWHSAVMTQHAGHEAKALRHGGRGPELMRCLEVFLKWFEETGTAVETLNLTNVLSHQVTQDRDWYAIAARARYAVILQGILGLEADWGGLTYVPCDTPVEARLRNLFFADTNWDVRLKGTGAWVKSLRVNGQTVRGTLKVPRRAKADSRCCRVVIERGGGFPRDITLARAPWLEVEPLSVGPRQSSFRLTGHARTPVWILSRRPVKAFLDDRPVEGVPLRQRPQRSRSAGQWNGSAQCPILKSAIPKPGRPSGSGVSRPLDAIP